MQHGFKKRKSPLTALKEIQSQIASKIAVGSLDLSAAFDFVNINLLIKSLTTLGLLPTRWTFLRPG
jgi:hypothetical protein